MNEQVEKTISVLVVDPNKVFARSVKNILENSIKANADIATNIWEVKRRLSENTYDIILADLSVTMDSEDMMEEFEKKDVTVIKWSAIQVASDSKLLRKPSTSTQIKDLVHSLPLHV